MRHRHGHGEVLSYLYKKVIDNLPCAQHWSFLPQIMGQKSSFSLTTYITFCSFLSSYYHMRMDQKEEKHTVLLSETIDRLKSCKTLSIFHSLHLISCLLLQRTGLGVSTQWASDIELRTKCHSPVLPLLSASGWLNLHVYCILFPWEALYHCDISSGSTLSCNCGLPPRPCWCQLITLTVYWNGYQLCCPKLWQD